MVRLSEQTNCFQCPKCGVEQTVPFCRVVEADADSSVKEAIESETLNSFTCPECGHMDRTPATWFYIDKELEVVAIVVPENAPDNWMVLMEWSAGMLKPDWLLTGNRHMQTQLCFGIGQLKLYLEFRANYRDFRGAFKLYVNALPVDAEWMSQFPHWPKKRLQRLYRLASVLPAERDMTGKEVYDRLVTVLNHIGDRPESKLSDLSHSLQRDLLQTGLLIPVAGNLLYQIHRVWKPIVPEGPGK